jgi:cob(I)alamin adenosyltransferase
MLYTRGGDKGTTKTFGCNQRISKSSAIAEALGAMDELNSFLGLVRAECQAVNLETTGRKFSDLIYQSQSNLFIIQAEVAGAPKTITGDKVKEVEKVIDAAEKEMPPIKSFFIPGSTQLGALFDVARTIARRAERRVIGVMAEGKTKIGPDSLAYLNRLSSLLYCLARLANWKSGIKEEPPTYK